MYESHFGLTTRPFSLVPNPGFLFLNENHENALTYLEYGLTQKVGFILLTGEIGSGKTTLIRYMLNEVETEIDVAVIFNTNFTPDQLFRRVLVEFEIACNEEGKERYLEMLYEFLIDRYAKGRHVILIVDEAQNLTDESLEDLRMLSNLQTDEHILLQIMLVGQPELRERLNSPQFEQLVQRIAVNYHITPLNEQQTGQYIGYRLKKAGGSKNLFTPAAIRKIFKHSGGIPRTINLICDTALVYGFAEDMNEITAMVVDKVLADKVCMSVDTEAQPLGSVKRVTTGSSNPNIMERIHQLEISLNDLRQQHDTFVREVRNDLTNKYKALLDEERQFSYRLLVKLDHLRFSHRDTNEMDNTNSSEKIDGRTMPDKPTIIKHTPEQTIKKGRAN